MPSFPYQVMLTVGQPTLLAGDGDPTSPEGQLILAPLPDLVVGPGFTILVGSFNMDGTVRPTDFVTDVTLTFEDQGAGWDDE